MTPAERLETVERICAHIEEGWMTKDACKAEGIDDRTLRRWVAADPALDVRYTRARTISADALAEEAVGIATGAGHYGDAQERRLAYDALRWLAGKRRPKDYGDKQSIEVSGGIEHLHLDALRSPRIQAKASIDNGLARILPGVQDGDGQPIDTEGSP